MSEDLALDVGLFVDDRGEKAREFPEHAQEGYFNLYVNGVMQEGQLYRVDRRSVTVGATGQTILAGTPLILESVGFAAIVS